MVIMKMSSTDKICMVCGDKALGYNFNAVTCESCKAFFRRNALSNKEFNCPFNNNCEITIVTRRFCQKCRLEKCFTIGMRKEYIMSDEDKVIKRMKIEQNRAKRKSSSGSSSNNNNNNNNSNTTNKTNNSDSSNVINETPPVKMKKTYTTLSSLRCTELSKLTEIRNSNNSSCEYWELIENNDETLSIDEDIDIDSKYNLNISNVQNYTELSSSPSSSSSIISLSSPSTVVNPTKTSQKSSSSGDGNRKTLKNTITNVVATENIEKSTNLPVLDENSTATEIIDRIVEYPEDSSKVINHLMKTPADSLATLTKILNSQKDAMRLIGHLISTPGDGLKIISKIMNSPFDALTVFTKFMSSPTDAIEIIAKIASSPGEVVQFIKQLMNSPEDALEIMNKFMNSPAEALRMLNKMVNRPRVDSTSSSTIPLDKPNANGTECEESQEILMLNNTTLIIDNNIINCNSTVTNCNNKEYDTPTENHHIKDENPIIDNNNNNNNNNNEDSNTTNDIHRNDNNANNIMIKSMLGSNQLDSPPPLVSSSILNSPPMLSPPVLIDQSPLPFLSGLSTPSLPPPPPPSTLLINDNVDPSLPTSTINNSTELQHLNTTIITNKLSLDSPSKQHHNDELIQEHEDQQQQPPQQDQDGQTPSTSLIPSSPDITRRILQDVVDQPILPYSIESVLCEAIKLEYEAYNSLAQSANNSRELNDAERAKLNELIVANKALYAPLDEDLSGLIFDECNIKNNHNSQDPQLLKLVNLTAIAIRRLIKMSKKINAFKNMCQEDQVALLKGGCTEMMILRSVMQYDVDHATWKIPHNQEAMSNIKVDVLKLAKGNVYEEHENFLRTFDPKWRKDENIILIMCAIVLFTPTRPKTVHADVLKLEQNSYYYLLRRYLESVYPGCEAKSTFLKLIQKINELQRLNEVIIGVYLDVNPAQVEPLLREIFDLKNH